MKLQAYSSERKAWVDLPIVGDQAHLARLKRDLEELQKGEDPVMPSLALRLVEDDEPGEKPK